MKLKEGHYYGIGIFLIAVVFIGGIAYKEQPSVSRTPDRCEVQRLFDRCMARLPKGPDSTVFNDWAEVVDECQSAATKNALWITVEQNRAQVCPAPKD